MQGLGEAKDGMDGWNMDGMVWRVRMWTCVCVKGGRACGARMPCL